MMALMTPGFPLDERPLLTRLQHEVHVWLRVPETLTDQAVLDAYVDSLSGDERARWQQLYFEADRKLFLVSHGMLRQVLSRYAQVAPSRWQFSSGEHGRPEIAAPAGLPVLRFNLTHTRGLVACVVSLGTDCGIDVESRLRRLHNPRAVARKMFTESECDELDRLTGQGFRERFFRYWTLHEAYCKATGAGIVTATRDFWFSMDTPDRIAIHFPSRDSGRADQWQFACLQPTDSHVLAVALRSGNVHRPAIVHGFLDT